VLEVVVRLDVSQEGLICWAEGECKPAQDDCRANVRGESAAMTLCGFGSIFVAARIAPIKFDPKNPL
jgi:hypothetical protein